MPERRTVAVIRGEDAAPEAVDATLRALDTLDVPIDFTFPLVGAPAEQKVGSPFPDEAREAIDAADSTLFGATSGPSGFALFYLRFGKQTFAGVRPARFLRGARSPLAQPDGIDLVIVRENLEGLYCGLEGPLADLAPLRLHYPSGGSVHERQGTFSIKVVTEEATRRIARFAADLAVKRAQEGRPGRVTIGAKHNILKSDRAFVDLCSAELRQARVAFEDTHIDNLARRLVAEPHGLDVVLVPNLYGDILSDLAAGGIGGLGLMPSGCYGDDYAYFEPPHGTAPDLVGLGRINPTAQMLSAVMMLDYLEFVDAADRVRRAIDAIYATGRVLTRDQGGDASTEQFTNEVIRRLAG